MSRFLAFLGIVLVFLAGGIGWRLGGLVGSFLPRTILATALPAGALFLFSAKPRAFIVATLIAAVVSGGFFILGLHWITPFLAWPAAAAATGILSALAARRTRAKVASVLAAPVLGVLGFAAGAFVVGFIGFALNEARIVNEALFAGATGYGLLTIAGMKAIGRFIDRKPETSESAA